MLTPALADGMELGAVPIGVPVSASGEGVGEAPDVFHGAPMLSLDEGVAEAAVSPIGVVMLAPGKEVTDTPVSADEMLMLALDEGVMEAPVGPAGLPVLAPDEVLMFAFDEVVRAPVASAELPVLAPDETLTLALDEGVMEAPVTPPWLTMLVPDDAGMKSPVATEVLTVAPDDGVAEMPVPKEVMLALCGVAETPVARELLHDDVMEASCAVVAGEAQAHVNSTDEFPAGDEPDVA